MRRQKRKGERENFRSTASDAETAEKLLTARSGDEGRRGESEAKKGEKRYRETTSGIFTDFKQRAGERTFFNKPRTRFQPLRLQTAALRGKSLRTHTYIRDDGGLALAQDRRCFSRRVQPEPRACDRLIVGRGYCTTSGAARPKNTRTTKKLARSVSTLQSTSL